MNVWSCNERNSSFSPFLFSIAAPAAGDIFWSFDGHANDLYNQYNGVLIGNPTYVTPGYNGQGSALAFNGTNSQYVLVAKYKNMVCTSFTWEMWAYSESPSRWDGLLLCLTDLCLFLETKDASMLGMCQALKISHCMHLVVRNNVSYFGLYSNDCSGSKKVTPYEWHHFAFVYDYSSTTEYLYLDGILDCYKTPAVPFLATEGNITIGAIPYRVSGHWKGYMDQVSYTPRAKNASEISWDATLVAYYSFDDTTRLDLDSGPNGINGVSEGESRTRRALCSVSRRSSMSLRV